LRFIGMRSGRGIRYRRSIWEMRRSDEVMK
jgi:hypothetical protein